MSAGRGGSGPGRPERPLNLPALARSAAGARIAVPGSDLEVQELGAKEGVTPSAPTLLAVLEGQAIVDLPGGRFHHLKPGDALQLAAGVALSVQPIAGQAILSWLSAR